MPPETGPCYLLATTPLAALKKFFRRSLYTPRLRRGLAAISSPHGSIILRYGKATPIYRSLGSLAVKMVRATLVAAIAAAVQFAPPKLLPAQEVGRPALIIEIDNLPGSRQVRA